MKTFHLLAQLVVKRCSVYGLQSVSSLLGRASIARTIKSDRERRHGQSLYRGRGCRYIGGNAINALEEVEWMDRANCSSTDTNQFFTVGDSTMYENIGALKRICGNCEVIAECREYSLRYNVMGWWANTSEKVRREERRRLNITAISITSEGVYE